MGVSQRQWKTLSKATLSSYNLTGITINKQRALDFIHNNIIHQYNELNSDSVLVSRCDYFKVRGTTTDDYREKLYVYKDDLVFLCGIRHYGGDVNKPFLEISPSFSIDSSITAFEIYENIKEDYKCFNPKQLCFWSKSKVDVDCISNVVMGQYSNLIKAIEPWPMEWELDFIGVGSDKYYRWYLEQYKQFNIEESTLAASVQANDIDTMNISMNQNLLKLILLNGKQIGLIAAESTPFLGTEGIYFNELLLIKEYRNQGIAKAMQRAFVQRFVPDNVVVWGTINSSNFSSFKTAEANERQAVRFECFVNIETPR